jgi:hypothetical protein
MKTPRIHDFDPKAAERQLGTPLDGMPAIEKQKPIITPLSQQVHVDVPHSGAAKPLHKNASVSTHVITPQDKVDKYSTYIRPGYKKEIKMIALEKECKDYEVLDEAISMYLASRKKIIPFQPVP